MPDARVLTLPSIAPLIAPLTALASQAGSASRSCAAAGLLAGALACVQLSGCASVHQPPAADGQTVLIHETAVRRGSGWYEVFAVTEIDGLAVERSEERLGAVPLRVAPGQRQLLLSASVRHGGADALECPCRATAAVTAQLEPGQRLRVDGRVAPDGVVSLRLVDARSGLPMAYAVDVPARGLPPRVRAPLGGGWVRVPMPERRHSGASAPASAPASGSAP